VTRQDAFRRRRFRRSHETPRFQFPRHDGVEMDGLSRANTQRDFPHHGIGYCHCTAPGDLPAMSAAPLSPPIFAASPQPSGAIRNAAGDRPDRAISMFPFILRVAFFFQVPRIPINIPSVRYRIPSYPGTTCFWGRAWRNLCVPGDFDLNPGNGSGNWLIWIRSTERHQPRLRVAPKPQWNSCSRPLPRGVMVPS